MFLVHMESIGGLQPLDFLPVSQSCLEKGYKELGLIRPPRPVF